MNCGYYNEQRDFGPDPYAVNPQRLAAKNHDFRVAVWTGNYLQMTIMCIPVGGDIGFEIHDDTDQLIRIEQGSAVIKMGECREKTDFCRSVCQGDAIFVPAGFWHNVINAGNRILKVSSVYAPPHHPRGTVQHRKEEND